MRPTGLTVKGLKDQAKALRAVRAMCGIHMTHSQALERVARLNGYRSWGEARALVEREGRGR